MADEDKRLERLYDYTKFHIGIYLSAAGGVAALIGSDKLEWVIGALVRNVWFLYVAFVLLMLAGMCGGMVATSLTECRTFEAFWSNKHHPGLLRWPNLTGAGWVHSEHLFFWLGLFALAGAIIPVPWAEQAKVPKPPVEQPCCCACPAPPPKR